MLFGVYYGLMFCLVVLNVFDYVRIVYFIFVAFSWFLLLLHCFLNVF